MTDPNNPPRTLPAPDVPAEPATDRRGSEGSEGSEDAELAAPGLTRRWFLVAGGAAVVAGGAGVGAAFLGGDDPSSPAPRPAPVPLLAAVAAERALIADLDAATSGAAPVRALLRQVRDDHAAHLTSLRALAAQYDSSPNPSRSGSSGAPSGTPRTKSALRAAEQRASTTAAGHAEALDGRAAVLLASIAACEAGHAEMLR